MHWTVSLIHLYHVVPHGPGEDDVCQQPRVVARAQAHLSQSEISITQCWPIRCQYYWVFTNHRSVLQYYCREKRLQQATINSAFDQADCCRYLYSVKIFILFGDNCIEAEAAEALRWCTEIIPLSIVTLSVLIQFITPHRWWGPSYRQCTPTILGTAGRARSPLWAAGGARGCWTAAATRRGTSGPSCGRCSTRTSGRTSCSRNSLKRAGWKTETLLLRHWRTLFTYFHGAHLDVKGEVGEVHRACSL